MTPLKDEAFPVLGTQQRAEKLIEWSKRSPEGKTGDIVALWGLILRSTAKGENPYFDIYTDNEALKEFTRQLGPGATFVCNSYGVTIAQAPTEIAIFLQQTKKEVESIFSCAVDRIPESRHSHLGRVHMLDTGPVFYSHDEVQEQADLEKAQRAEEVEAPVAPVTPVVEQEMRDGTYENPISLSDLEGIEQSLEDLLAHAVE